MPLSPPRIWGWGPGAGREVSAGATSQHGLSCLPQKERIHHCFQLPKQTQTEPDRAEMLPPPQETEEKT